MILRKISRWTFTDEKWWDIVGPAASKYVKGATKMERKLQNQVCFYFVSLHLCVCFLILHVTHRFRDTKVKRVASRNAFISGAEFRGFVKRLDLRGQPRISK